MNNKRVGGDYYCDEMLNGKCIDRHLSHVLKTLQ